MFHERGILPRCMTCVVEFRDNAECDDDVGVLAVVCRDSGAYVAGILLRGSQVEVQEKATAFGVDIGRRPPLAVDEFETRASFVGYRAIPAGVGAEHGPPRQPVDLRTRELGRAVGEGGFAAMPREAIEVMIFSIPWS